MMEAKREGRPFRLGFIGGGLGSAVGNAHRIGSQMDRHWSLEAGCFCEDLEQSRETGRQWGVEPARIHDNWRALLEAEKGRLDAVAVLTPIPTHTEIVLEALDAGHAVICEKALATSSADIARIQTKVEQTAGFLAVTLNYSGYPMLRELRHFIATGKLGKIQQVHVEMPQEGFVRLNAQGEQPRPQDWRLRDYEVPTISLDLGVHLHHLIYYLTRERPLEVVADQRSYGCFPDIVDNVMCMVRYSGQVRCQMWYTKAAIGQRNGLRLRVYGSEGSAEWFQLNPEEFTVGLVDGTRLIVDRGSATVVSGADRYNRFKPGHPDGFIEAFGNLYEDIADCLSEYRERGHYDSEHVFGAEHAGEGLRLLEAVAKSSREGRWVSL